MTAVVEPIDDDEIIIRRIPPATSTPSGRIESTYPRLEGGLRATSARLSTKPGEFGLSCSRLRQTSPRALLDDLWHDAIDPSGWKVCRLRVRDVRALGLEIIHKPTERDPGHSEIVAEGGVFEYPNNKSQKLAKKTRVLTDEEVVSWKAGDRPAD